MRTQSRASHQMARRSVLIVNELGYELRLQVVLETIQGRAIFNESRYGIPCCTTVDEGAPTKISRHNGTWSSCWVEEWRQIQLRKFGFSNRVVNKWNSLPNWVVSANTTYTFKARLEKFWQNQDIVYDFRAQLQGTGSPVSGVHSPILIKYSR